MIRWDKKLKAMSPEKREYALGDLVQNVIASRRWDRLEDLLLNIFFLESKAEAGAIFELAGDFAAASADVPATNCYHKSYSLIEEAIRRDIHFIDRHPSTLFQCLWNSCWWYDSPDRRSHIFPQTEHSSIMSGGGHVPKLYALMEAWLNQKAADNHAWLRSLLPPETPLGRGQVMVLRGHSSPVCHLSMSPDMSQLVSTSLDRSIRVWGIPSGQSSLCLTDVAGYPSATSCTQDGRVIAALADGVDVSVIDVFTRMRLSVLRCEKYVQHLLFSSDGHRVATKCSDGSILVWESLSGRELLRITEADSVSTIAIAPNGNCIVFIDSDRTLRVKYLDTGHEISVAKDVGPCKMAFSPDGALIAYDSVGELVVYGVSARCEVVRISPDRAPFICALAWSPDGRCVVTGDWSGEIVVWDASTGQPINSFGGEGQGVECLALSRDGGLLFAGLRDTTIRGWDMRKRGAADPLVGHRGEISAFDMAENSALMVCAGSDGVIQLWDANNGLLKGCLQGHSSDVTKLSISSDARKIVSCSGDRTIRIWSCDQMSEMVCLRGHTGAVTAIDVSESYSLIASGGHDTTVRIWNTEEGQELACLKGHAFHISSVCLSPDGKHVLSTALDHTLRIWDIDSKKEVARFCEKSVGSQTDPLARYLEDGQRIVFVWCDGTVRIWDTEAGKELAKWMVNGPPIHSFTTCHNTAITMSEDYRIRIWDCDTYRLVTQYAGVLLNSGDVIAAYPYRPSVLRAVPRELDGGIICPDNGQVVAWSPDRFLSRHPYAGSWVSVVGNSMHVYMLEGDHTIGRIGDVDLLADNAEDSGATDIVRDPVKLVFLRRWCGLPIWLSRLRVWQ